MQPCKLNMIQMYTPTTITSGEVMVMFYAKLEDTVSHIRYKEITLVKENFNGNIGETKGDEYIRQIDNVYRYETGWRDER